MKKIFLFAVANFLFPAFSSATEITAMPDLGTPAQVTDSLMVYDFANAPGNRVAEINFTGAQVDVLRGDGTMGAVIWTAVFDAEVVDNPDVVANTAKATYPSADAARLAGMEDSATADQNAADVPFTPNGSIASFDVQAAIQEVRDEAGAGGGDMLSTNNLYDVANAVISYGNIKQMATETVTGAVERATTAEAVTGTDTERAITAAGLTARLAAPASIGGTIPATDITADVYYSSAVDGARYQAYPNNTAGNEPAAATVTNGYYSFENVMYQVENNVRGGSVLDSGDIGASVQSDLDVVSQSDAEAGTATDERIWTAERVSQAIAALASGAGDLKADGTVPLTDSWDVGAYTITGLTFVSDQSTGSAPFVVASTTKVANLNAEEVDGESASEIVTSARVGAASSDLNVVDAGVMWENAGSLNGSGNLITNSVDSGEIVNNAVDAGHISDLYAYEYVPIAWMQNGTSAPAALDDAGTRSPYVYRDFDHTADEDLNFIWFVPTDLFGATIQFRVFYLITNATGPSATEGVAFGLSGVSLSDNDATNGTKGSVVVIADDTLNAVQHDTMVTGWSGDVTIINLAAGETAECALIRDVSDTVDDYAQDVGAYMLQIRYVQNPAR